MLKGMEISGQVGFNKDLRNVKHTADRHRLPAGKRTWDDTT
ncbi:hypothetical protein E6C60_4035 [Paenibacillus algicola]|uniref:Uncharacterized protein n=1 Tax=Paenibacillus algicola TaxID=2565926 RepID=A0A4P8XRY8_9BACL|nr:hypothetical protein E6C60_4035 [Paenibacillus algicola]